MNKSAQLAQLQQLITQLRNQYAHRLHDSINMPFERQLFNQASQSCGFYFDQMQLTLQQIEQLHEQDIQQCAYLSEKLLSQYTLLKDTLEPKHTKQTPTTCKTQIHQLPARERLEKYYEALHLLNEKLMAQQDQLQSAINEQQRNHALTQLNYTKQRRQKCLDAIENLEEYLAFKRNVQHKK